MKCRRENFRKLNKGRAEFEETLAAAADQSISLSYTNYVDHVINRSDRV